jgi:hypothetical protein
MSAQETKLLAIMRADREVQDRRQQEITYASLRQRRRQGHDGRHMSVVPERIDQRVDECVDPAPQVGFHLVAGRESLGAARVMTRKI